MREVLATNCIISLRHVLSGGTENFKIKSVVGKGGACICYRVTRGNREGLLKEFYPKDLGLRQKYNMLERNKSHQLIAVEEAFAERFEMMKKEFSDGYNQLENAKKNKQTKVLANYLPNYEVFEGLPKNSTVYIWMEESVGVDFEEYLQWVWKNAKECSAHKVHNILCTINTIATGVCGMHKSGLNHRDIKPENFLVEKDALGEINPHSVCMFDINSFAYGTSEKYIVGTEGYMAPEAVIGRARYYSDIYSLGAMLFRAVVGENALYNDKQYSEIERLVKESELISKIQDAYLETYITEILKKSLVAQHTRRYKYTESFIEDMQKAIARLLPYTESEKLGPGQRLKIVERNRPIDSIPVFQNLLYKKPVYDYYDNNKNEINIAVIGGGVYAQAFMDVVLQTLQIKGKRLNLNVYSENAAFDRGIYMKARPDICRFFDIDDTPEIDESYGSIRFINREFSEKENDFTDILTPKPCYILVSLGDDSLNKTIAKTIAIEAKDTALVNFVWSGDKIRVSNINPVYVSQRVKYSDIDENLTNMAFNTHLVWNDSCSKDYGELYKEFREPYNYKSSIAYALSISYKLYSMGLIEYDVERINSILSDENVLREISYYEHRRWVTEMVCKGWTAPINGNGKVKTEMCIKFLANKNKKDKVHLCIAKGSTESCPDEKNWDNENLDKVDDLDRVSIEIYKHFAKEAKRFKAQYLNGEFAAIKTLKQSLSKLPEFSKLFAEYEFTVDAIVKENSKMHAMNFEALHSRLENKIKQSSKVVKADAVVNTLDSVLASIKPAVHSIKKTNYKKFDDDLVKRIPFIITNRPRPKMTMVFNDGRYGNYANEEILKNVASAITIVPKHITYLYYCNHLTNLKKLTSALKGVLNFFDKKNMATSIDFVFACNSDFDEALKSEIDSLKKKYERIKNVEYHPTKSEEKATLLFASKYCNDIIEGTSLPFDTAVSNMYFTEQMSQKNYFEFNSYNKGFGHMSGCEYLKYTDVSKVGINVEDLFVLKQVDYQAVVPDMFTFYEPLWKTYTTNGFGKDDKLWSYSVSNWNALSEKLKKYAEINDAVITFEAKNEEKIKITLTKILPMECSETVRNVVNDMRKHGFIHDGKIIASNSDSVKLSISFDKVYEEKMNKLFSKYNELKSKLFVESFYDYNTKKVKITKRNLYVEDLQLSKYEYGCLERLSNEKLINDLVVINQDEKNKTVSFVYPSYSIKNMLEKSGNILEIHIYYQLLKNGDFDDVATNVVAQGDGFKNEFDVIITKGFKTILIECKAVKSLEQDFYFKLSSLAKHYGVNNIPVIISTEHGDAKVFDIVNQENESRGDALGVVTISKKEDVTDINKTIVKILKEGV